MSAAGNAQLVLVDENHTRAPMPPPKRKVRRRTDDGCRVNGDHRIVRELGRFVEMYFDFVQNYNIVIVIIL